MATLAAAASRVIRAALAGVLALGWVVAAPVTSASCVVFGTDAEMLVAAESVFVGRVVATTNMDRRASVGVEEVWQGPDLPALVDVIGGEEPGVGSSVDRQYANGERYLFAVDVRDGALHDNACSMTQVWDDGLLRLRPADVRVPSDGHQPDDLPAEAVSAELPFIAVSALVVAVVGIAVFGAVRLVRSRGHG